MNNLNLPNRIKNYLDGAMSAKEARQFEADLESDFELKKAFVAFSIDAYKPLTQNAQKSKELVDSVFNSLPPFPTPSLPLLFRLKMWFQPLRNKLIVAVGLLVSVALGTLIILVPGIKKTITANAIQATCKNVAGETLSPRQIFERASAAYCGHETDTTALEKLQQLSAGQDSFCMADYYIAHWYLQNGRYADAVTMFEACLAAQETIESNPETVKSRNALLLNTILARFGRDKDVKAALAALDSLATTAKPGSTVAENIARLKSKLWLRSRLFP